MGGIYISHMRNEAGAVVNRVGETIAIGEHGALHDHGQRIRAARCEVLVHGGIVRDTALRFNRRNAAKYLI